MTPGRRVLYLCTAVVMVFALSMAATGGALYAIGLLTGYGVGVAAMAAALKDAKDAGR